MNQPATQQQGDKKQVGYNETLSQKGRASVAASTVLILSSLGFVQLSQLPFIGAALKPSEGSPMMWMLFASALYFWYRFVSYKRSAELDSKVDELGLQYARRYLQWKSERLIAKGKSYLLNHGNLVGFHTHLKSPAYDANKAETGLYWSVFHLKEWKACSSQYVNFEWPQPISWDTKGLIPQGDTYFKFVSDYMLSDSSDNYKDGSMESTMTISALELRRLKLICELFAWARLPDFLEKTFPTLLLILALALALLYPTPSPAPKATTSCQEAAKTLVKACS